MKVRTGFVSNSSSSSFMIKNKTKEDKTLVDFVAENRHLIDEFNDEYSHDYSLGEVLASADDRDKEYMRDGKRKVFLKAGEKRECIFGDEEGDVIGNIFDYILRDGGSSESFSWRYYKSYR